MGEQSIILILLIIALAITLVLYVWKAKKCVEYKNDERWHLILLKSTNTANLANWLLIMILAVGVTIPLFSEKEIVFSLTRVVVFGELFIGIHNALELFGLVYYDKKM